MERVVITKIIKVGDSNAVILPKIILRALNWERGDYVIFGFNGGEQLLLKRPSDIEIRNLKPLPNV